MSYLIFLFLTRECLGVSNLSALEGRIVKGYEVQIHQHPHSVFLHFKIDLPSSCGSTLITDQAVITAAHCLDEIKYHNGKITAFLGASVPINSAIKRHIVLFKIHPRYNPQTGKFNLGIGFFNKVVLLSNEVQRIPIILKLPHINQALYTTGWENLEKYEVTSLQPFKLPDYSDMRHLKASKQKVISRRECQKLTKYKMTPALWCTVSINGHHYHGDSGNGLVTRDKSLVGVVSYMINEITIYSDVIREQLWMNDTLEDLLHNFCKNEKHSKT